VNLPPEWTTPSGASGTAEAAAGAAAPWAPQNGASRSPEPPPGYETARHIGTGRHSTTFLCIEEETGGPVAVKVYHPTVPDGTTRLAAHSELLSAGAASMHPCSVSVKDAGFTPDHRPYVVEEVCWGGNAQYRLATSGALPVDEVIVIGTRLALALHSGHRRGVLHLDVRPANILFDNEEDCNALLADHGIARALQRCAPATGAVFDPLYAPRELFGWEPPGPAADVYGLGATLYALLNGEPPYSEAGRADASALYQEVLRGEPPAPARPGVPEPLLALIRRMLSANPDGRPPLTEVHRALRLLLPASPAARVPALEPEPAPAVPLPGWDPADDATPEEQAAVEQTGVTAQAEARRQSRKRLIAASTALVVFAASATVVALLLKGEGRPASSPTATPSATTAQQVPKDQLPGLMPQNVTVTKAEGNIQVTWQRPKQAGQVIAYVVQAKVPGVDNPIRKTASLTEPSAVFPASSVSGDTCYTVASLITANGAYKFASAPAVCHTDAS